MEERQACRAKFKARRKSSFWAQKHGLGSCLPLLLMNSVKLLPPFYFMARAKELIMPLNRTCCPVELSSIQTRKQNLGSSLKAEALVPKYHHTVSTDLSLTEASGPCFLRLDLVSFEFSPTYLHNFLNYGVLSAPFEFFSLVK